MKANKKSKIKMSTSDKIISVIIYTIYTAFAFVCAYPFYYIFINTISSNDLSKRGKVLFLPQEFHLTNYEQVLQIPDLFSALKVSVARTVIGTALTVIIAAFLGYMFTRETLWGRKFWYRFVAITMYFNAGIISQAQITHGNEPGNNTCIKIHCNYQKTIPELSVPHFLLGNQITD